MPQWSTPRIRGGVVLILIGSCLGGGGVWGQTQSPADLVQAAMTAAAAQEWQQAADLYRQVLELEPTNSGLYNNLGVALRRAGDTKGAIEAYRRTLELDPSLNTVYVNLAIALLADNQWAEALESLEQARIRLPEELSIVLYQGLAHEKLQQWSQAAAAYEIYTHYQPTALGYYRLAIAHWQSGDGDPAVDAFRRAARLDPEVGLYIAEAGRALAQLGLTEDARAFLETLPSTWANPADYMLLARLAYRADQWETAEAALQQALLLTQGSLESSTPGSLPPQLQSLNIRRLPASLLNDIGVLNADRHDIEMATSYLEAAAINADEAGSLQTGAIAYTNLADVYLTQGELEQALVAAQAAIERDPLHPQALNTLAATLLALNRIPSAIETLQRATQLDPEYWQAHRNLGIAYALTGSEEAAVASLHLAIEAAPTLSVVQSLNDELLKIQSRLAGTDP